MAKARTSLRQIDVHEDYIKEEGVEERSDESMDPLDESGHTVDSSDEEVEDAVQEDMARFEETFVGINTRFRLINRIGEGMSPLIGLPYAGPLTRCRYILYCVQGRGPGVRQVRQQLGHR
jgi:hypothetical protein